MYLPMGPCPPRRWPWFLHPLPLQPLFSTPWRSFYSAEPSPHARCWVTRLAEIPPEAMCLQALCPGHQDSRGRGGREARKASAEPVLTFACWSGLPCPPCLIHSLTWSLESVTNTRRSTSQSKTSNIPPNLPGSRCFPSICPVSDPRPGGIVTQNFVFTFP